MRPDHMSSETLRVQTEATVAEPNYPFVPKSNRRLRPGQFFSIPLSTGRYAAGRVMVVRNLPTEHVIVVVIGLMDWSGDEPPTHEDLAGRAVMEQAISGFQAIANNGGAILGERPLELDGLVPMPTGGVGVSISVWGWRTFQLRAEEVFGSGEPHLDAARRFTASN
jgi:hypothetical protein